MATVSDHYSKLLSPIYSWMSGGFEAALDRNTSFFAHHDLNGPSGTGVAVDLGAGCGFQSIPLARLGFDVIAIDLDEKLLSELATHGGDLRITCVQDDLSRFSQHTNTEIELAVCMTDTILHIDSKDNVRRLIHSVYDHLSLDGKFVVTFREFSHELVGTDRFIPVRSDENRILTCFLEFEPEFVKVFDLVYQRQGDEWQLNKSFYRKQLTVRSSPFASPFRRSDRNDFPLLRTWGCTFRRR